MNLFTFNGLCSEVARVEGKKSQARVGDVREVLSDFFALWAMVHEKDSAAIYEIERLMHRLGKRRLRKLRRAGLL